MNRLKLSKLSKE